jgi:outer membrane protein assembly factor BamB
MTRIISPILLLAITLFSAPSADNWPQFRGPHGDGHADAQGLPLTWAENRNVVWKTPIHDRGWSSPVIFGDQIWLTTASPDGKRLSAICIDRKNGKVVRDIKLFDVEHPQYAHPFNSYASPTPVLEAGRAYITFGSAGTACIDTASFQVLWQRRDIECNHFRGAGSSPILYRDLLVMDFDGSDHQFVIALDKRTGKTAWRTERSIDFNDLDKNGKPAADGDFRKAFSTPQITTVNGRTEMISLGSKAAYSYDPLNGHELWRVEERAQFSASTRPVVGFGMMFYPTGFPTGQLFAVRLGGRGLLPDSSIAWRVGKAVPNKPSILLVDDLIYMVNDTGIASCIEAKTGTTVWQKRIGGEYSASPIYAEGKIWFFSEDGKATAIKAARSFELLGESQLEDGFMASPAVAGKAVYLRTKTHLYRIESPSGQ